MILETVNVRDVLVIERGEELRLAPEASEAIAVGREQGGQNLDGNVAAQLRVARAIISPFLTRREG